MGLFNGRFPIREDIVIEMKKTQCTEYYTNDIRRPIARTAHQSRAQKEAAMTEIFARATTGSDVWPGYVI